MANDIKKLKRVVRDLRSAKNNQTIKSLDKIAELFGCEIDTNSANENRLYYAPFKDLQHARAAVAIPHGGKAEVLSAYVGKLLTMLNEIIERLDEEQGKDGDLDG